MCVFTGSSFTDGLCLMPLCVCVCVDVCVMFFVFFLKKNKQQDHNRAMIASCSFYDKEVHLWDCRIGKS